MKLSWQALPPRRCDPDQDPRHDAFTRWAQETGFRDARLARSNSKPGPIWLMLELRAGGQCPTAWLYHRASQLPAEWLRVPAHYAQPLQGMEKSRFCTALADVKFIEFLGDHQQTAGAAPEVCERLAEIRSRIDRYEIGLQGAWGDIEPGTDTAPTPAAAVPPVAAVVGIIDDGLPFAHERFCWRDAAGSRQTRFLSLWDQSSGGEPDRYWGLGRTLSMQTMNAAIANASDTRQRVDEDAVYADLGLAHLLRHRITHGAHVADLACGMPLGDSLCAAPAIVGVQLRPMESTLCISPGAHLFDAVRFVVAQADQAGAERVVVNASVGNIAGPHDGSSMFESAIDALVGERGTEPEAAPVEVVLPEGNSYLSRCHAWATIDPNCEFGLEWHLRPDDGTSSYLEIWLRPVDAQEDPQYLPISLTLKPPGDGAEQVVSWEPKAGRTGETLEYALREGSHTIAVLGLHARPANGRHWLGLLTVAPTAPYEPWRHCAPAGAWQLKIGLGDANGSVYCNVYSQRDEKSFGHQGRGRQAIIEDHLDKVHDEEGRLLLRDDDAFRRRVGTINGLANGKRSQVVGGLVRWPDESLKPARYSSVSIPVDLPAQLRRTLAITEDSPVLHGIHAAGCRSGSIVALSGTSMAAPQMTRTLAAGKPGAGPASAQDFNGTRRAVVAPDPELQARARLRRGR